MVTESSVVVAWSCGIFTVAGLSAGGGVAGSLAGRFGSGGGGSWAADSSVRPNSRAARAPRRRRCMTFDSRRLVVAAMVPLSASGQLVLFEEVHHLGEEVVERGIAVALGLVGG